jgi:DNA-binding PadR family transcriptional regulator
MLITSDLIRGNTETLILAKLIEGDNYGYEINKWIFQASGGRYELKEATLYTAFKRLEDANCIVSYWGDRNTGARRKYYRVTERGKEVYQQKISEWLEAKALLDSLLNTGGSYGT